jgi:hypothetical protein
MQCLRHVSQCIRFLWLHVHWYWLATLQKSRVSDDSLVSVLAALNAHMGFSGAACFVFQSCNHSFHLLIRKRPGTLGQSTKLYAYTLLHLKALQYPYLFHMVRISWPKNHTTDRKNEKVTNPFSDIETENKQMYVKYYTLW